MYDQLIFFLIFIWIIYGALSKRRVSFMVHRIHANEGSKVWLPNIIFLMLPGLLLHPSR